MIKFKKNIQHIKKTRAWPKFEISITNLKCIQTCSLGFEVHHSQFSIDFKGFLWPDFDESVQRLSNLNYMILHILLFNNIDLITLLILSSKHVIYTIPEDIKTKIKCVFRKPALRLFIFRFKFFMYINLLKYQNASKGQKKDLKILPLVFKQKYSFPKNFILSQPTEGCFILISISEINIVVCFRLSTYKFKLPNFCIAKLGRWEI